MTKKIAIIDPFVKSPAHQCFNHLVELLNEPATYHMPSLCGIESLHTTSNSTFAYIVLGSASHVQEELLWHKPLSDFLLQQLQKQKPVLGCCFGHQLICHAFGSEVGFINPDQEKLSGIREIRIGKDFWNFKAGESFKLAITHRQVVQRLAPGLIAVSEGFPNDIVIHETLPFMGIQAHPEASDYFFQHEVKLLCPQESELARRDGDLLLQRFLAYI
jgi:GMP synthase-like glutamine amidotransferase